MGLLSRRRGPLPDFVIIGAQRGGTTSLYRYLVDHPDVVGASEKEVHFFDINYHEGEAWYRSQFAAARRRGLGRRPLTGEATPYYLFHPLAAPRLAATVPRARIIAVLRDPVDRAFSHYKLGVAAGWETLSFEEAIDREQERLAGEAERIVRDGRYRSFAHQYYSYVSRGRYVEQLPPWLERFPPERVLILRSEDLYADPTEVVGRVLAFLGLRPIPAVDPSRHNSSDPVEMKPDTRRRLMEHFRPYNERLYELLGHHFGWG